MHRGFWIACIVLCISCPAYAAELQWDVPPGCPDVHALEQETERALNGPLSQYPLYVNAVVSRNDSQLNLSLRINLPNGGAARERELQANTCQELMEAAAVAIALAAADSGDTAAVAQASDDELRRVPPPSAAAPEPESEPHSQLVLGASGLGSLGALPRLGLGVEAQATWMYDWLRIALAAAWFPERATELRPGLPISFGLYFVELLLCGQQQPAGSARFFACAGAQLGSMSARLAPSVGEVGPTDMTLPFAASASGGSTPWRALGALIGASYPVLPPLELTASLSAWAPLTRPRFYVTPDSSPALHEPSPIVAQLLLGLLFSL